ncbi:MAG: hypothetical protein AAF390_13425 [Pseudomonadota bacterium]
MDITPTIKGRLAQEDERPVRGARVTVRSADGILCGAAVTDGHGLFEVALRALDAGGPAVVDGMVFEIEDALGEVLDTRPERSAPVDHGRIELRIPSDLGLRLIPIRPEAEEAFDSRRMAAHLDLLVEADVFGWDVAHLDAFLCPPVKAASGARPGPGLRVLHS